MSIQVRKNLDEIDYYQSVLDILSKAEEGDKISWFDQVPNIYKKDGTLGSLVGKVNVKWGGLFGKIEQGCWRSLSQTTNGLSDSVGAKLFTATFIDYITNGQVSKDSFNVNQIQKICRVFKCLANEYSQKKQVNVLNSDIDYTSAAHNYNAAADRLLLFFNLEQPSTSSSSTPLSDLRLLLENSNEHDCASSSQSGNSSPVMSLLLPPPPPPLPLHFVLEPSFRPISRSTNSEKSIASSSSQSINLLSQLTLGVKLKPVVQGEPDQKTDPRSALFNQLREKSKARVSSSSLNIDELIVQNKTRKAKAENPFLKELEQRAESRPSSSSQNIDELIKQNKARKGKTENPFFKELEQRAKNRPSSSQNIDDQLRDRKSKATIQESKPQLEKVKPQNIPKPDKADDSDDDSGFFSANEDFE